MRSISLAKKRQNRRPQSIEASEAARGMKVAASLSIHRASEMSPKGREAIVKWLLKQAKGLLLEGDDYAPRFTARYWHRARNGSAKAPKSPKIVKNTPASDVAREFLTP